MCDLNRMDRECAKLDPLIGAHLAQVGLVELVFDVSQGELCAIDRDVEFGENPGQRADMVFVAVCEDDAAHALAVFDEVGNVRNDDVDAEKFGLGEHEAGVDDDDVVTPAEGHAVHSELAKAAERNDVKLSSWHGGVKRMLAQRARDGDQWLMASAQWPEKTSEFRAKAQVITNP